MRYLHPWQNQKPLLVGDCSQGLAPLSHRPTDELVASGHLPGSGSENHHRQLSTVGIPGQILHIFSDRTGKASVMVALQELSDPSSLGQGVN
jgi:hypothetical protein